MANSSLAAVNNRKPPVNGHLRMMLQHLKIVKLIENSHF
jgi:hypothetical protein